MKKRIVLIAIITGLQPAHGEIFKCTVDGKAAYQARPCKEEKHESTLNGVRIKDEEANYIASQRLAENEQNRLKKRLLETQLAAQQAEINRQNAAAEAARSLAASSERSANTFEENSAVLRRELAARRGTPDRP